MLLKPKQIIIFGDSCVYGYGDSINGGWVNKFKIKCASLENGPIIYPLGIRGDGIERVAKRWKKEFESRGELRRKLPDAIILKIGTNDTARVGRKDGRNQLSADAFKYGVESLLKDMKKKAKVWVMGINPVNEILMPYADCLWYSNKDCLIYERALEEVCIELDISFLPIHRRFLEINEWESFISSDGIHLNTKGHSFIYKMICDWKNLSEFL